MKWFDCIEEITATLKGLQASDCEGRGLEADQAFYSWQQWTCQLRKERRTIYLIGNGASASMASHLAADLAKNAHVHTEVFSDLSLLTAIANDMSYEEVFAEPLRRRMAKGDMLIAISSSGNSPNIVKAVREAIKLGGTVVTLSAMGENNAIRQLGDLNFYVPASTYGGAESSHATILHYWMDMVAANGMKEGKTVPLPVKRRHG